jgi:DNA-directed RNA polymerase specialized sigma24 family protein
LSDSSKPHPALRDFTPEQWDEMVDKLMGFTYRYFEFRFEGDIKNAQTPDGDTFEDIAQEIVKRVLTGTRYWNPEKDGDLLPYMAGQVRSLFNHGFSSWNAKNIDSVMEDASEDELPVADAKSDIRRPQNSFALQKSDRLEEQDTREEDFSTSIQELFSLDPELVILSQEIQVERNQLFELVLEAAENSEDNDLWALIEAYLDDSGEYKPGQIASRLGIPTTEFNNRRKRLVRHVKKYLLERSQK